MIMSDDMYLSSYLLSLNSIASLLISSHRKDKQ